MAAEPGDEFREFVEGLVPLDEAQRQRDGARSPFETITERISGRSGVGFHGSFFTGGGLLLVAAALAALMPARAEGGFWRVGRGTVADLLAVGNGAAVPLLAGAIALVALAGVAALRGGGFARGLVVVQPFIGGVGVAGVGLLWVGVLAFVLLNLIVLLLIIVANIVGAILIVAVFIGMLVGLFSQ